MKPGMPRPDREIRVTLSDQTWRRLGQLAVTAGVRLPALARMMIEDRVGAAGAVGVTAANGSRPQ